MSGGEWVVLAPVSARIVSTTAVLYQPIDEIHEWTSWRLVGKVVVRFRTSGGEFTRTIRASVADDSDELPPDRLEAMRQQLTANAIGALRRHGIELGAIEWVQS